MVSKVLSGKEAVLEAVKLSEAEAHVTFQDTELCKKLGLEYQQNSEKNILTSAIGSTMTGKRSFVQLSNVSVSEIYKTSFMRMPIVSVLPTSSFDGAVSTHNPLFTLLDSNCIIISVETNQELLDTIIQAYKISEDRRVLLPSIIQYDMEMMENVNIPSDNVISKFLTKLSLPHGINAKKPLGIGPVIEGYGKLKLQQAKALENAEKLLEDISEKWNTKFRRKYNSIELHNTEDADTILITMGTHSSTAKKVSDDLREQGKKTGVIRIRTLRPFPLQEVNDTIKNIKKIGVADSGFSINKGLLQKELGLTCPNFIISKHPSEKDYHEVFENIEKNETKTYWVV